MNTQLNVSTTVNMEALNLLAMEFKRRFELSDEVIHERLMGRRFVFNRDGKDTYPFEDWEDGGLGEAIPMVALQEPITIASTDSSCILLGETSDGAVYAVRAAVCFSSGGVVQGYFRIGPIIVHLSPKGACGLPTQLEGYELRVALSDHLIAERIIRNTMERRILSSLLDSFSQKMIVMADGSLKHPLDSYPDSFFTEDATGSSLIGFSKSSAMISTNKLSALVSRSGGAAYSVVEDGPVQTIIAKFARDGLVFRLDVARGHGRLAPLLGSVLYNDGFSAGYPESLRVAHHLSVFSRSEDMALKAYLTNRHSLKHMHTFHLRRVTLGGLSNSG
ncbi:MAG: hypothetical protein OK456_03035 [Thaumarchaeota archaeon]|nr:hypothetical protein [Nitrososphaerota archaeon]